MRRSLVPCYFQVAGYFFADCQTVAGGVYAFGEYAELLIFVAAGARTHGNAQEALDRLATDMAERASELEGKYRELCRAVGINTGEELANG